MGRAREVEAEKGVAVLHRPIWTPLALLVLSVLVAYLLYKDATCGCNERRHRQQVLCLGALHKAELVGLAHTDNSNRTRILCCAASAGNDGDLSSVGWARSERSQRRILSKRSLQDRHRKYWSRSNNSTDPAERIGKQVRALWRRFGKLNGRVRSCRRDTEQIHHRLDKLTPRAPKRRPRHRESQQNPREGTVNSVYVIYTNR